MPAFCLAYLLNCEQTQLRLDVAKYLMYALNIFIASGELAIAKGGKILPKLILFKEVATPIIDNEEFKKWINKYDVCKKFLISWEYLSTIDITHANASSILGQITKDKNFRSFYNTWQLIVADKDLQKEITKKQLEESIKE